MDARSDLGPQIIPDLSPPHAWSVVLCPDGVVAVAVSVVVSGAAPPVRASRSVLAVLRYLNAAR
ncbi:hypothetical protein [Micromonospora sp. WMMD736]|uniref:hypothetical protein n=1 Tax=Micromonospora sp. WMMD736 TaxID=3404112 RepID=UPI003B93C229